MVILEASMLPVVLSMMLFALIGAISPGPVNIIATGTAASFGFRRTLPHVIGATISYTLVVLLAGLGLSQVLFAFPNMSQVLQFLGAAFLLYMAYKIGSAPVQSMDAQNQNKQPPSMLQGALCQFLNPKAWLVSMSGVAVFVNVNNPYHYYLLAFCLVSFFMCFIGVGSWALMGNLIRKFLSNAKQQVLFNRLMALLLVALVMLMLFSA